SRQAAGENGDVAFAAELFGERLADIVADQFGIDVADEVELVVAVGVEGHDVQAGRNSLADDTRVGGRIQARDSKTVRCLADIRFDTVVLVVDVGLRRSIPNDIDVDVVLCLFRNGGFDALANL